MTSLSEVYDRKRGGGGHATPQRVVLGVSLFLLGAILVIVGLVVASTEILASIGIGRYESRRYAGLIGGIGVPAVFIGVLTVLPASKRIRAAAAMGAGVAVIGVALFWTVYPSQWLGAGVERHYTFETATIYFLGILVTFWCFFVAVANFKTRNDPGGTVELEVLTAGETKIIEVDKNAISSSFGGIGLFGRGNTTTSPRPVSDGGSSSKTISSPVETTTVESEGADVMRAEPETTSPVDQYCGNCQHFEYVRERSGMQPYCQYHRESMDDMQPCEQWRPNSD